MPQKQIKKSTSTYKSRKSPVPAKRAGVTHHVKRAWHATPKFVHGAVAGAFVGVILAAQFGMVGSADALAISTTKDCDDYAIIKCGVVSTADIQKEYKDDDVAHVYSHFGISSTDIANIGKYAVAGTVYDTGKVTVNGKTVATDVKTASWLSVNGSSKVTKSGTSFYVRSLKSSWSHSKGGAYVVMKDGVFQYAILASCGNPIIGDAVQPPKPKPTPLPPAPTKPKPTPAPTPPPPTPTPQPIITPPPLAIEPEEPEEPEELPNAGPGAIAVIAAATVAGGFISHRTHRHLKKRKLAAAHRSAVGKRALHGTIKQHK